MHNLLSTKATSNLNLRPGMPGLYSLTADGHLLETLCQRTSWGPDMLLPEARETAVFASFTGVIDAIFQWPLPSCLIDFTRILLNSLLCPVANQTCYLMHLVILSE